MKHLSAQQNLGYDVQAVELKDIYRWQTPQNIWVSLIDWFENYKFGKGLDKLGIDRSKWNRIHERKSFNIF